MYKLILLAFIFLSHFSFSQDYNSKIHELNGKIETAISNENFDEASKLKKEKDLYIELQKVIAAEDFSRAEEINNTLKAINESSQSFAHEKSSLDSCIVYIYSGNMIGSIGGFIEILGVRYNLKHLSVYKTKLPTGTMTFKTNVNHDLDQLTRTLESDKIYFLEYGNKTGALLKIPTLKFTSNTTFISNLEFTHNPSIEKYKTELQELQQNFSIKDSGEIIGSELIHLRFESNCNLCKLELNGTVILDKIKKNTIYTLHVPNEELFISYSWDANDQDSKGDGTDRYEPMFLEHIMLLPRDNNYILLEGKMSGKAWIKQLNKLDLKNDQQKYEELIINK